MKSLFSFLFAVLLTINCAFAKDFYVSPKGSDKNSGTREKPFATIKRAQLAARNTPGKVVIFLRGGTHYLSQTVVFTPEDSRKANGELTIKPYANEKVVVSGGTPLTLKWESYKGKIMKAKVGGDYILDQLFINSHQQRMARYPNYNPAVRFFGGSSADALSPERIASWKNPTGGFIHALHRAEWGGYQYQITGKDGEGKLKMEGGYQNNRQMGMHEKHRFVENIFEELDTVGEWYYNKEEKMLYYYPEPSNTNLAGSKVEIPRLKHLFEFKGSEKTPVKNINIEGLELTHTLRTFMETKEPLLRSDWTIYRGGAVLMEGAESCQVRSCYFNHVGGNAIFLSNYNRNNKVSGCHIAYAGASGVCFVGDPKAVRSPSFEYAQFVPFNEIDTVRGPKTNNYPANCTVENTLMYGLGQVEKQVAGVQISMSMSINAIHNTIYDVPRAGINISEGTWGGHEIAFNDVFNTVLESGDHGAFNSWGRDRYWNADVPVMNKIVKDNPALITADVIKTITLHDNRFHCEHGWDIDLDDGSSNYRIYNNVCLNGGLKLREGFYRTVENNIILNNSFHPHVWFENSGDVFKHNIVTRNYYPIGINFWGKEIDYNFFADKASLEKSQQAGTDQHSTFGNPEFVNPSIGDYSVKSTSKALALGFKNFATDKFGVTSPSLRKIAKKAPIPVLKGIEGVNMSESTEWFGLKVKNLETLGERSATGMPEEIGVLVLGVDANSPFVGVLKPNDVILSFKKKTTNKVAELVAEQQKNKSDKTVEMTIFRSQNTQKINLDKPLK
ncbi:PDZ domain-containing protein [Pedobacter foliorum]|uniref:PDZ domain-containing protein n=1 Tax=Pedobacter foliorum TaxID=2739058 RepID=UPI0015638232|nr:PDZ domain-containing protein [Pedobacter foliorum]NRF39110.1 PDZ domain-containing protein [Pedobacter foliorum]